MVAKNKSGKANLRQFTKFKAYKIFSVLYNTHKKLFLDFVAMPIEPLRKQSFLIIIAKL